MPKPFLDFVHDLSADDVPAPVMHAASRAVIDLVGVGAGGAQFPLSQIIRDHAAAHFGAGAAASRMLYDGRPVSPAGAALAGGMTIDALDGHDGFNPAKGHAGCGVFPAALAMAEATGIDDGRAFLATIVLGYEIGCRAALALHASAPDYHTSGAWVAVACAAISGRMLGLDAAAMREAIGIAEYHGPRSQMMRCIDHPTMLKDGSGWGAMAGVSAAYLAADGFTGAPAITVERDDAAGFWADLGDRWLITEQYHKPYPVCRWAQPSLQAVLDLRTKHDLQSTDVERIHVVTFHESLRLANRRPQNTEQAQYSTAFPTAAALVRGTVGVAEVSPEAFKDPEILRLAESMEVSESDDYNETFPAMRRAHVELLLKDGRRLVSPPTVPDGDFDNLPDDQALEAKFQALAAPRFGDQTAALAQRLWDLESGGSVRAATDVLCSGPTREQGATPVLASTA